MKKSGDVPFVQTSIVIRSQFDGMHWWPEAPEEVKFLRFLHRHLFKVEAEFQVNHANRQLEFFLMQKALNRWLLDLRSLLAADPTWSCEMMAESVLRRAVAEGFHCDRVVISEDGENDGIARFVGLMMD